MNPALHLLPNRDLFIVYKQFTISSSRTLILAFALISSFHSFFINPFTADFIQQILHKDGCLATHP